MTQADIFEKAQASTEFNKKESAGMVEAVFAIMKSTLMEFSFSESLLQIIYTSKEPFDHTLNDWYSRCCPSILRVCVSNYVMSDKRVY